MRYFAICVFVLLSSFVAAEERLAVRPVDAAASAALDLALARSAIARHLATRLDTSNVIVHVETSRSLPLGIGGMTRFVASRGGFRYLRITIAADLPDRARTAILAHELQHACEVAESTANDVEELRAVFEHRGHRSGEFFETTAAIETERNVLLELRSSKALQAEPVVKFHH
jgi:hypothetical protein